MADCPLAAVLSTAAARLGEPDLAGLADGLTAPVRARVQGGPGAGVTTTVRVLRAAGVRVCGPGEEPDVDVRVLADPLVAGDGRPDLLVLNKADLSESVATFGIAKATGIPVVAFSALAAAAAVDPATDDRTLSALADALGASVAGADRTAMRAALRRASGVDAVRAAIDRAGAPARYRRIGKVLAELSRRAAGPDGARIADLLAGDDVVLSRMLAAAEVLRAAGMPVPSVPADPLAAAIRWQRYARGPVSDLHRACGADLSRGALRLWDRLPPVARPVAPVPAAARRAGLRTSRIEAGAAVRAGCAALRAELQAGVQQSTRAAEFVEQARRRVAEVAADLDAAIEARLEPAAAGPPGPLPIPAEPPLRMAALESRLAGLLGLTFGVGAALTLGRMLAELVPGSSGAVAAGSAALGLTLGLWVIRARRVLAERAAADRWVLEVTAALRSGLEDRVSARFLAAEVTLPKSGPFRGSGRQ